MEDYGPQYERSWGLYSYVTHLEDFDNLSIFRFSIVSFQFALLVNDFNRDKCIITILVWF